MKNQAAQQLGRLGGSVTSEAKTEASRENGKLGGRPSEYEYVIHWTKYDGREPVRDHAAYDSRESARRMKNIIAAEQELNGGKSDVRVTKRLKKA